MKMKKILFFVMSLVALSMATACNGSKTTDSTSTVDSDSIVVDSVAQVDSVSLAVDSVEVVAE